MTSYWICLVKFKLRTAENLWSFLYNTKYTLWTPGYSETIVSFNIQWKASKLVSVKMNDGGTRTLVDSDILNKKDVLWPPKKYALIENKTVYLIW